MGVGVVQSRLRQVFRRKVEIYISDFAIASWKLKEDGTCFQNSERKLFST